MKDLINSLSPILSAFAGRTLAELSSELDSKISDGASKLFTLYLLYTVSITLFTLSVIALSLCGIFYWTGEASGLIALPLIMALFGTTGVLSGLVIFKTMASNSMGGRRRSLEIKTQQRLLNLEALVNALNNRSCESDKNFNERIGQVGSTLEDMMKIIQSFDSQEQMVDRSIILKKGSAINGSESI